MTNWKQFFEEIEKPVQIGRDLFQCKPLHGGMLEELYQSFKARMMEDLKLGEENDKS